MRHARLHRAPTLPAFLDALVALVPTDDIARARGTAVLVPTRSAAGLLRRTIETRRLAAAGALVLPDLLTRRDFYERLHQRLAHPPRLFTGFERDVMMEAAAHQAVTDGATPPFHLRSALIAAIVALYDAIRRQQQTLDDFDRLVLEPLHAETDDEGAERVLRQTRFLSSTFRGYEARRDVADGLDEHTLRDYLHAHEAARPYRHILVATPDDTHDPTGLGKADFDLLMRMPGVEQVDLVATDAALAAGLRQRLDDLIPGLEEVRLPPPDSFDAPVLLVPEPSDHLHFSARDREDELSDLVRRIRTIQRRPDARVPLERVAVVFQRPLPYIYLARSVFEDGGVPVEARDALPLAAEPPSAALDLILSAVSSGFSRAALVALLRSPQFAFRDAEGAIGPRDVSALDAALEESGFDGDPERLESLAAAWLAGVRSPYARWDVTRAVRTARVTSGVIRSLLPLATAAPASTQLDLVAEVLDAHATAVDQDDPVAERQLRAREAVRDIVHGLAAAHRAHHDLHWDLGDLGSTLRRWIESETFSPQTGAGGVQLIDASAAPFGEFDAIHLVGLVEGEWPSRARRNIFYSPALLRSLGWPSSRTESDNLPAARAAFLDLVRAAARHVSVSTFSLEEDTLVEPSTLLEDLRHAALTPMPLRTHEAAVFVSEALAQRPVPGIALPLAPATWLACRLAQPDPALPRFHGAAGAQAERARSVSALELYASCPFRFFARHVLRLPEEREDESGLTPLERGRFLHAVFEDFYARWQRLGYGSITVADLERARAVAFDAIETHVSRLPAADAALERTRLVGSPVAPGLIDVVLRMEAERDVRVVERRLEYKIDGAFVFHGPDGARTIGVRGVADRIDLLADGTFRVLDYKSSRPDSTLQIAVYTICVRQLLEGYRGRRWEPSEAAYIAFRGDTPVVPLLRKGTMADALAAAEAEVVAIVDGINAGSFPPRPRRTSQCATCAFARVCRKDYVETHQPAPAV